MIDARDRRLLVEIGHRDRECSLGDLADGASMGRAEAAVRLGHLLACGLIDVEACDPIRVGLTSAGESAAMLEGA